MTTAELTNIPQFSAVAKESIQAFLEEIVKHWEGVHGGQDIEALHDMRVATRRLRASLSVFQPAFPARPFDKFERKIAYLTDALGDARDTDVFLEFITAHVEALTVERASEKFGLHEFARHLQKRREEQQVELLKTLRRLDPGELRRDGLSLLAALPGAGKPEGADLNV
jgi:CHAD domain-containing protein